MNPVLSIVSFPFSRYTAPRRRDRSAVVDRSTIGTIVPRSTVIPAKAGTQKGRATLTPHSSLLSTHSSKASPLSLEGEGRGEGEISHSSLLSTPLSLPKGLTQCITSPPSTLNACPVMFRAPGPARNTAIAAMSSGSFDRPIGMFSLRRR